ncbi:MAG TPA: aldo/keto reductase [Acidimicrobiales bacterium]|nr:aldo/keto reductase [Acidimicrobiales bacterium]
MSGEAAVKLGASDLVVSELALGSWKTFERLPKDEGLAVMAAARRLGVTFLDDARYNDDTGRAPIPTGYSEVLFGELFRTARWPRSETVVANKLWWEFWPQEGAAAELDGSLGRMQFDYIDLIYANPPPEGLGVSELVEDVVGLVRDGKARAWGIVNWPADRFAEAVEFAASRDYPPPCAAQLPYSLAGRSVVENPQMTTVIERAGAGLVASFVLFGGILTGKYRSGTADGRMKDSLSSPATTKSLEIADRLCRLADELGESPATLAVTFAAANPLTASTLVGATRPEQLAESAAGVALARTLEPAVLARLRSIGQRPD